VRLIIEIQVDQILLQQGRTFYWLAKQTGISHTTLWRIKKGRTLGINFETLEKMCRVLECQPGDILSLSGNNKAALSRKTERKQKR
jgi:putative transcriptional regulator